MTIDLSFFKKHGYQILKGIFPKEIIEPIASFLAQEKDKTLSKIKDFIDFQEPKDLIARIQRIADDDQAFQSLEPQQRNMLSGHFSLEARLSPILHAIPQSAAILDLCAQLLPGQEPRMHMPPTARFVLPGNYFAGVPAHQDVSYNKHIQDFFVVWVPFCAIDDDCGGVMVHHGSGYLPEQIQSPAKKFWLQPVPDYGYEKIHCKMDIGDALLLNKWVVHQSMPNFSDRIRYSSDFRFFGSATTSEKHYLDIAKGEVVAPALA
jgi:ectoine hydroxylase-related dioxygenase (phytanoyl-CoA dioxygenase family)